MKKGKRIRQINNLVIHYSQTYARYQVWTPVNKNLEEFEALDEAVAFCRKTKDYCMR
jgi:hypothetical protein